MQEMDAVNRHGRGAAKWQHYTSWFSPLRDDKTEVSDRLLSDIGVDRSDIPRVVDGLTDRELSMRPVSSDAQVDARWRGGRMA